MYYKLTPIVKNLHDIWTNQTYRCELGLPRYAELVGKFCPSFPARTQNRFPEATMSFNDWFFVWVFEWIMECLFPKIRSIKNIHRIYISQFPNREGISGDPADFCCAEYAKGKSEGRFSLNPKKYSHKESTSKFSLDTADPSVRKSIVKVRKLRRKRKYHIL